ncbi:aldo/keto reductase [Galbitalea sp. SE-J8]|uniref:aldo/keto reductase n=1 Tax=Galbitalea sp. SE-J8 TaxID=3054952 RepID=UPI00259C7DDA|nr:aldo/keto reductase [Galbitalea sp. SE-J8]MDM4762919.1 aldo/keto reductase [Galbitalea sp. SE-J8]
MRQVELGRTGVRVTEFMFGAGTIGGVGSPAATRGRGLSEVEGMVRLDEAFDRGIRVVDTANSYAGGVSEEVVGRWLERHDDVLIETKVGNLAEEGQTAVDLSRAAIERGARRSRERLGRFELYLVHALDDSTPDEEWIDAMTEQVEHGPVHAWGVSNVGAAELERILAASARLGVRGPGWVQNGFNLLQRDDDVQALCASELLGYTGYSPLAGGLLSDRYLDGREPEPGSRLDVAAGAHPSRTPDLLGRVARLDALARELGTSAAALALWWLRWHPLVTATLVAPRRTAHWADVDAALSRDDDPALRRSIDDIFDSAAR